MIATENSQSLAEFRQNPAETIDRLNQTGEPEVLTVDGETKAVLISPAVYQELMLSRDVANIKRAQEEIAAGKFERAEVLFDSLHAKLTAMKAAQQQGTSK